MIGHPDKKVNKEMSELNKLQIKWPSHTSTFHPTAAEYTFFSAAHGTLSKQIIFYDIKQALTNTRKLKYLPVFYLAKME
jgi:hypothetical protein